MEEKKYILNLLHFNLEFVAGEYNTYDKLLTEAFEPALDVLLDCPNWHCDIEVSGMHLEYIEKHFPWMLAKLRTLNSRGQVDVICVHYSETIWPAFPRDDFFGSWAIDKMIVEKMGLKMSPTFFAQENFFGEGVAAVANKLNIKHATIPEKNYSWPYHDLMPLYPVYEMSGVNVIIRGEGNQQEGWWVFEDVAKNLKIKWRFDKCGDGEPWVGDDPYVHFWKNEEKIKAKKEIYKKESEANTKFITINEFVQEMQTLGISKPPLKPVPDGPWGLEKPGVFQWMGLYFSFYELDVEMRSLAFRSRAMLLAAQTLVGLAQKAGIFVSHYIYMLDRGWHKQINSEVSDSSGWVPTLPEMYYAIDNALTAFYWGEKISRELREKLQAWDKAIDTGLKLLVPKLVYQNVVREPVAVPPEWELEVFGPQQKISCFKLDEKTYELEFSFVHLAIDCGVKFPFQDTEALRYSPALMDDKVIDHGIKDYNPNCTHLFLPLPNGLINLKSDLWVIKHNDCAHVACKVNFKEHKIEFMALMNLMALGGREELGIEIRQNWKFTIVKGTADEALKVAAKINLYPIVPPDYKIWPSEPYPWIPLTRMVSK